MPTPIQEEAARLLAERKQELDRLNRWISWLSTPLSLVFGPQVAIVVYGVRTIAYVVGDDYSEELAKVIRGERDTLPSPSDNAGSDAGAS